MNQYCPQWLALASALTLSLMMANPVLSQEEANQQLTLDNALQIQNTSGVRISPDGSWIAYTLTRSVEKDDERRSQVWMVPAAGGPAVAVTDEKESSSSARWSPDNRYLAFLSARDEGKTQVWALYRNGGEAQQLTDTVQSVGGFEWSPDGKRLALVLQDPSKAELKAKEDGDDAEMTQPPHVIDRLQFKTDYVGYLDRRRTHIYVLDIESGELTQLTSGDYDDSEPRWSPDGSRIAFTSNRSDEPDRNYNTDIWTVSSVEPGQQPLQITSHPGSDDSPAWSPDGKLIAHRSMNHPEARDYAGMDLAVSQADGSGTRRLTAELDRWVYQPGWSADGRRVYFLLEDSGEQHLAAISPRGGKITRLFGGKDVVEQYHRNANGDMALRISRPHSPAEVFKREGPQLRQVSQTHQALLNNIELGTVEKIVSESTDGAMIESFIIKPPGFVEGKRYPVVLDIHGGPVSQYDWRFSRDAQLLAARGYLVVHPNPRGSSGYGYDFSLAIWQGWGGVDFHDVMAAVDDVIERGWGDADRLGVMGWSYGGILTNHVITQTQRFKAAVTGASSTLYVASYGHDMYQRWWEQELGLPWEPEARAHYERLSPFNKVANVTTPTLIMGGEIDWNVPIHNSEQLYIALKRLGVDTQLIVYPGEYHGISTPSYIRDMYQRHIDWFDKYLK